MILVEKNDQHLHIKLNRPQVRNAFNPKMIQQLTETFQTVKSDKDIKYITLSGEGSVFCAGADLTWMQSLVTADYQQNRSDAEKLHGLFETIWDCQVPVIARVKGAAFGGALGLMACADYVLCDEKTQMSFSEVKLGIAPAVISEFLVRKCNVSFVSAWMISGLVFNPVEAQKAGLVHQVGDEKSLDEHYAHYKKSLDQAGPLAVRETKKLLRDLTKNIDQGIYQRTTDLIAKLRVSPEGQEGLKSFLEKRKPNWRP